MEMSLLKVVILGIVEGLTEYIPVSSTGHLVLVGHLLNYSGKVASSFEIFIQFGAILAVVIYYKERFIQLAKSLAKLKVVEGRNQFNMIHVILSIFPAVIFGFLFYPFIKQNLFTPATVAVGLICGGIVMLFADKIISGKSQTETLDTISYKQAFFVGLAQCFSLWPGVSRSAATILGGIFTGFHYKVAAEFSFIIAVPVIALAICYDLLKNYELLSFGEIRYFLIGGAVAFFVAYLSIGLLLKLLSKYKLVPFGWYRILIGTLVLIVT